MSCLWGSPISSYDTKGSVGVVDEAYANGMVVVAIIREIATTPTQQQLMNNNNNNNSGDDALVIPWYQMQYNL